MKTWTVHLQTLNPHLNPIAVEGEDDTYYRYRRTVFVQAECESEAVAKAHGARRRDRAMRERAS